MHSKLKEQTKTIVIKGGYGAGNFGDDALMFAAYEICKRIFDSESLVFVCRNSDYIQKIIPGAKVVQLDSRDVKDAHIMVFGGGTQFCSFHPTAIRGIRALYRRIAHNVRRPIALGNKLFRKIMEASSLTYSSRVAAIGIGLGPFVENCKHMRRTKELFTRMDYVAVRDRYSYDLCKQWRLHNVSLRADLCYFPDLWNVDAPELNRANTKGEIRKIGVILRDWPHTVEGDSYAIPVFQVVHELRTAGKKVEFISFASRSDIKWAKRLKDKDEQFKAWNPDKCTISEFMELLSGYDAFITARYHGAIFASILRKPVVCIEVEQKLRLVSGLFGVGTRLWTYPFSASECLRHISDLEGDYSIAVQCLARSVKEQGFLVEKMIDEYRQFVTANPIDRCRG